jgi:hypothetical protein
MRWLALVACVLLSSSALALDSNDRLKLTLAGGEAITGWFVRTERDAVVVATRGHPTPTRVQINLIVAVDRNGQSMDLSMFFAELDATHAEWLAWVANPPAHPHPALMATMSALAPGSGHAALGEWRSFAGYAIADATLIGLMVLEAYSEQRMGMLLTLGGVDLILRGVSIGDAVRISARRRRRLRDARSRL